MKVIETPSRDCKDPCAPAVYYRMTKSSQQLQDQALCYRSIRWQDPKMHNKTKNIAF